MGFFRAWVRTFALAFALASCVLGCAKFDGGLLDPPAMPDETGVDGGLDDGGGDGGNSGQAGAESGGSGGAGSGGSSGDGAGGGGGSGPTGSCEPAAPDAPESCAEVCPEICNDEDDDCDGEIDEDPASTACALSNALAACIGGECFIAECMPGFFNCDDEHASGCEVPEDDLDNCGTCRAVCSIPGAVEACIEGDCVAIGCDDDRGNCDDSSEDCEAALTSTENCGECGEGCDSLPNATGLSCSTGECLATTCELGYDDCNEVASDGCEQALTEVDHCNGCEQSCDLVGSSGDDCDELVCRAGPCDDGYGDCDGDRLNGCESLATRDNCNECGQICGGVELENIDGASCATGDCVLDCSPGFSSCDLNPFNGCESSIWQGDRCGACDTPCMLDHATPRCPTGTCEVEVCATGWDDCDDIASNGCETSLNDDETCGSCTNDCTVTTDPVCSGGVCGDVTCPDPNTADCAQDGLPCEIDLTGDEQNCGACNAACTFTTASPNASIPQCVARVCTITCDPGFDDCNQDYRDGCETPLDTLTHCGACNTACSIANATESCSTRECLVVACAPDFRDCDSDQRSCERAINTVNDCGACNAACSLPNASAACVGSPGARSCGVSGCSQFFANCDSVASNGCEVNLQTDTDDCGACNYDCTAEEHVDTATCGGGSCTFGCDSGYRDCNNLDPDGCETSITTNTDCGGCNVACSRTNATTSCSTGNCQIVSCDPSHSQCDGNTSNGCESLTTLAHCGACNTPCLPPNATGTCASSTCQISSCAAGWENCDGDPLNGCERNTATLGPCLPEANCTRQTYGGGEYYTCPTLRSWADARTRCQTQLFGELARIDDTNESQFVRSILPASMWIGATDAAPVSVEGEWRWANDGVLFWTGLANGTLAPGRFAQWNTGEPNQYMGAEEDCLEMAQASGNWNDQICTNTRGYVCEVAGDLCPADPLKTSPGQCGCGVADTDNDNDRTANCADGCPDDASKVVGGICGCGMSDADGDGDGTANCNDLCPMNAPKTAPGQCGCAVADTDGDGDGTANCNDACPNDPARSAAPCAYPYTPTNFNPAPINFVAAPSTTLCGTTVTVDTTAPVTITGWCGPAPTPVVQIQTGGPDVVILPLRALTIPSGTTLRAIGNRPLILAVNGDATITGNINARGAGLTSGAGGNVSCGTNGNGRNGGHDGGGDRGDGGGGGGAFGGNGSAGGQGDSGATGGGSSTTEGNNTLVPLRGGCPGGQGGRQTTLAEGGGGGGAVMLSVSGTLTVSNGARIAAGGGGGRIGASQEDGGGGGGSGGAVFLEANALSVASGAWVTANGGGGGSGNASASVNGAPGSDGIDNGSGTTAGGTGNNAAGNGGVGAGASSGAGAGGIGACYGGFFCFGSTRGAGGGGGGGGVGRIRYRGVTTCTINQGASPAAVGAGTCP